MKIDRETLTRILQSVMPGLANREIVEQSNSFVFQTGVVYTYNDEIAVSHPVLGLDFDGVVNAKTLYSFLSKTRAKFIEMQATSNELIVKAGRSRAGIVLGDKIKVPLNKLKAISDWQLLPNDFVDNVSLAAFSCSKDMSRPIFTCVNVRKDGYFESSDNYRLTRVKGSSSLKAGFLLPGRVALLLKKYNPKFFAVDDNWIHFKNENDAVFSGRVFDGKFPDLERFLNFKGPIINLPKRLTEVLDRCHVFTETDFLADEVVTVRFGDDRMVVEGKGPFGWLEETMRVKYKGADLSFFVNPVLLAQALKMSDITTCTVGENAVRFEGSNWQHVVALAADSGS